MRHTTPVQCRSRPGFTLIEVLTVVGIIALLLGILIPALGGARDQARRARVRSLIVALDNGLELFRNDFGEYPDSEVRDDPITDFPATEGPEDCLWGGHVLARAMVGHDGRGIDTEARVLRQGFLPENQLTMAQAAKLPRRGMFAQGIKLVKDTDPRFARDTTKAGRPLVDDVVYGFPILYYRADPKAGAPFCNSGGGDRNYGEPGDRPGVYALWDNFGFTGISMDTGAWGFWDIGRTGLQIPAHPIADIGSVVPERINRPPPYYPRGKTFPGAFHDENVLKTSGVVRPHNPDRFILLDAGRDGLWGTHDDIRNF